MRDAENYNAVKPSILSQKLESEQVISRPVIRFELAMRVISESNCREHWRAKSKRTKGQRHYAKMTLLAILNMGQWQATQFPIIVTLTRIGKRMLDDDNLAGAFKATRDGIADALQVNDGDTAKVQWKYAQTIGKAYGVVIEIQ
jgi:hypothetical protein